MRTGLQTTWLIVLLVLASVVALPAQERSTRQRGQAPAAVPQPAIKPVVRQPVTAPEGRLQLATPLPVIVAAPKAGQTIPLGGTVLQIPFTVQNLDVNKKYFYMPELAGNGALLGSVFGSGFVANRLQSSYVIGVKSGHYLASYADQLAPPGPGYQHRITVYEGTWGKGHQVAARCLSGLFGFETKQ